MHDGPFGIKVVVPVRVTRVSRVHDMGGQTAFGPVPAGDGDGPAFAAAVLVTRNGLIGTALVWRPACGPRT